MFFLGLNRELGFFLFPYTLKRKYYIVDTQTLESSNIKKKKEKRVQIDYQVHQGRNGVSTLLILYSLHVEQGCSRFVEWMHLSWKSSQGALWAGHQVTVSQ